MVAVYRWQGVVSVIGHVRLDGLRGGGCLLRKQEEQEGEGGKRRATGEKMKELGVGFEHRELAEDIEVLKEFAKDAVKDLCKNNLMLEVDRNKIWYLTCAEFKDMDMLWYGSDTINID